MSMLSERNCNNFKSRVFKLSLLLGYKLQLLPRTEGVLTYS